MSDEQLCGPWEGRWNRLVPHQDVFGPACAVHDDDYTTPAGMTRSEADARFLDNLIERAGRCPYLRTVGGAYWLFVRVGGWVYFDRRYDRAKAWVRGVFA